MRPRKASVPAGFRPPPKPKQRPLEELTIRELQDLHARNANILATPCVGFVFSLTGYHRVLQYINL